MIIVMIRVVCVCAKKNDSCVSELSAVLGCKVKGGQSINSHFPFITTAKEHLLLRF